MGHLYTTDDGVKLLDTVVYKCTVGSLGAKAHFMSLSDLSRRSRFTPFSMFTLVHVAGELPEVPAY